MNNYPAVILVMPQMGENIGFIARCMKNFGLNDLRIVLPRDGWPNKKAESASAGAIDIIDKAKIFESLQDASSDLQYLYASSSMPRDMNVKTSFSKDLRDNFKKELRTAIVFGRENSGLTNEEISLCNELVKINTTNFSSLNISHAASVIFYEIFDEISNKEIKNEIVEMGEFTHFINSLLDNLENSNFFKVPEKKDLTSRKIRNIFSRIDNLTKQELNILHGIINSSNKNE